MRKILQINLAALATVMLLVSSAMAVPAFQNGYTDIKFTNVENWVDKDGSKTISAGDLFYGIAWATTWTLQNDPTQTPYWSTTATDNLSAYFLLQVDSVTPVGSSFNITFKSSGVADPNGVFSSADLAKGDVLRWYTDTKAFSFVSPDGNPATDAASVAHDIGSVTDGTLFGTSTINGGYWFGIGIIDPSTVGAGGTLANNYSGLNTDGGGQLAGLAFITSPYVNPGFPNTQMVGQSNISKLDITSALVSKAFLDGWMFKSQDPFTVATPEPTTMLIMGSGLLGMFAARRRSKKNS